MFLCQVQCSNPCNAVLQLNYCVWINWKLLTLEQVQQTLLLSKINLHSDYVAFHKIHHKNIFHLSFVFSKIPGSSRPLHSFDPVMFSISFIYNFCSGVFHDCFGPTVLQINSLQSVMHFYLSPLKRTLPCLYFI